MLRIHAYTRIRVLNPWDIVLSNGTTPTARLACLRSHPFRLSCLRLSIPLLHFSLFTFHFEIGSSAASVAAAAGLPVSQEIMHTKYAKKDFT